MRLKAMPLMLLSSLNGTHRSRRETSSGMRGKSILAASSGTPLAAELTKAV